MPELAFIFQSGQLDQNQDEQAIATSDEEELTQIPDTQDTLPTTNSQINDNLSILIPSSDSEDEKSITSDENDNDIRENNEISNAEPERSEMVDDVGVGDGGVAQEHFVERCVVVHLNDRPNLDTGLFHIEREVTDAAMFGGVPVATGQQDRHVGVIGTVTTIGSGAYQQAFAAADPAIELTCAACPGFVEFVERGETDSDQALVLAERLLAPVIDAKVDSLLLGCTHYPFLARTISRVMGRSVTLVSSADETAFAVRRAALDGRLAARESDDPVRRRWVSSGDVATFERLGRQLLGDELANVEPHRW